MSQASTAAALFSETPVGEVADSHELGPTLGDADSRFETWRANTRVRLVRGDSVVQFVASSRGQARQLLDQAFEILGDMDARRARTSHLHPSFRS